MLNKSLVLLLILILLMGSLNYLLRQGLFSERLTRIVASHLQERVQVPVGLDRATLSLFPTGIVLEGLRIPPMDDSAESISADRVQISVTPWSLVTEVLFIKKIQLTGLDISHQLGETPLIPLPPGLGEESAPTPGAPRKIKAVIREIEIRRGRLELRQPDGQAFLVLDEMEGSVTPDLRMRTFSVHVSAGGLTVEGKGRKKKFDRVTAQLEIRPQVMEIRQILVADLHSRFRVTGAIQNLARPELALSLEASFPFSDFVGSEESSRPEEKLDGRTHFTGEVVGVWPGLTVRGNLALSDFFMGRKPIGQFKAAIFYQNATFSLSELSGAVLGGEASGNLRLAVPSGEPGASLPFQAKLAFREIESSRLLSIFAIESDSVRSRLSGEVEIEGQAKWIQSRPTLDPTDLTGKGWFRLAGVGGSDSEQGVSTGPAGVSLKAPVRALSQLRQASVRFRIEEGRLHLDPLSLDTSRSSLRLRGNVSLLTPPAAGGSDETGLDWIRHRPISFETTLTTADLGELAGLDHVSGRLDLSGRLTGSLNEPKFEGAARLEGILLRGRTFESAESDLAYENRVLRFKRAVVREKKARYDLSGRVSWEPPTDAGQGPFFDLSAKIQNGSPRDVVALFATELPLNVPASGDLNAKGIPKEFRLDARLQAGPGTIYGHPLDRGAVTLVVTRDQIVFEKAGASRGETTATGRGQIKFAGEFQFSVDAAPARLEDIDPIRTHLPELRGPFSGRISGRGSFRDPRIEAQLALREVTYQEHPIGPGSLNGRLEGQKVTADLRLNRGVTVAGEVDLKAGFPFHVDIDLEKVDIRSWFGQTVPNLTVVDRLSTTGKVKAAGLVEPSKPLWQTVDVGVHLTTLTLAFPDYEVENQGEVQLQLKNGTLSIPSLRFKGPGTALSVSGRIEPLKRFNLFVNGEADLDLFRIFTKEITYGKGMAFLALQITDQWENPKIRGGLTVHEGVLKSESLGQAVTIEGLGLGFNERQVLLESVQAQFGGGKVLAGGRIDLVRFVPTTFAMNLDITGAKITPAQGMPTLFDASLIFRGDPKAQTLQGDVFIRRASFERRLDWQTWVLELVTEQPEVSRPSPLLKDVTFNIRIQGKENLWINNNLAKMPLEVDLLLKGTPDRPVLLGRMETKGGTFSFRRNNFKVLSGTADFISPERIRPILDVRAVTRVRNYAIDLNLVGPVDKFDLILSSNPSLKDENEILCLLTFNRPCKEVSEGSKEIGAAEASAILSGEVQNIITDKVEEITGIDRIRVDPYYSTTKSGSGPMITVSKRLLEDKLYVTYASTLDPSEEQLIQMEYVINENVSLIGNRDGVGRQGGDIKFHFEFR